MDINTGREINFFAFDCDALLLRSPQDHVSFSGQVTTTKNHVCSIYLGKQKKSMPPFGIHIVHMKTDI